MAGVQTFEEEFLTCAICTAIYADPCTLTCQHSFCRQCVTNYIKTRKDAVRDKIVPCAFCRQVTPVPNPTRPPAEWARQLKPSLMLQGLMDRHEHTQGKDQDVCFLCKEVGETTSASSWCSDCEITLCSRCAMRHLKTPMSKKHDVFDLHEGGKVQKRRKLKCKEHEGEQLKFICKDCNKPACQTCCIIRHRACKHVVTIESMVPEIRSALTEKRRYLEGRMKKTIASLKKEESKMEELKRNKATTGSKIKSAFEEAHALLRRKEKSFLAKLDDLTEKQITEHQANVKSGQITTQMYQQHCEFIDQALKSESEMDMYEMYQVCLSGAVESVGGSAPDNRNTSVVGEKKFTPNMTQLKKAIAMIDGIDGTFVTEDTHDLGKRTHDINTSKLVLQDTIRVNSGCDHYDATVLTVDGINTIVVTDYLNKRLHSVCFIAGRKQIHSLEMKTEPTGIASLTRNRVAAVVTMAKLIVVAEVRPELVLISCLKTSKYYWGLTSLPDSTLAAGGRLVIDILDLLSGNALRSFTSQNTGLNIMTNAYCLGTTHSGDILVSDYESKSVYCLSSKGDVVFTYTPTRNRALGDPRGITVTSTGDILLADETAKKIIQLTPDGKYVRDILTSAEGIASPQGLCVDNADKLYVCCRSKIEVFGFK